MRPKFEVGEVVILQSKDAPQYNGEYVVRTCTMTGQIRVDRLHPAGKVLCGFKKDGGKGFAYTLEELVLESESISGVTCEGSIAEKALRKKHTPGELSFTDLMASLSSPKLITHDH